MILNLLLRKTIACLAAALLAAALLLGTAAAADQKHIGGYVDNAQSRFVRNVWNFVKYFQSPEGIGPHSYVNTQYFWAEPYEFLSDSQAYVNSEDFAYFSGHGNSYVFACHSNIADVDLRSASGYGNPSTGGHLQFIVFEDCLTVASLPEFPGDWWSAWLPDSSGHHIFQGLHQAIGFRTLSISDNGIPDEFAQRLLGGQAVWPAWFNSVQDQRTYFFGIPLHGSVTDGVPYPGFASVVLHPGLDNDSLGFIGPTPSASSHSLRTYWQY